MAGWLLLLSLLWEVLEDVEEAAVEIGVVLLVGRDRCVESDGAWLLLDEEFGIIVVVVVLVLVLVSDSGSGLMYAGVVAALCLRVGVELSLWIRARRGEGGDGIWARKGILGLKVVLAGGYIVL
jgi:hypothetical protein